MRAQNTIETKEARVRHIWKELDLLYNAKHRLGTVPLDKPVRNGNGGPSSNQVSLNSFGHTGFTGTIAWADPDTEINYVFLSNRVYQDAENWKLVRMDIRTKIQVK